MFKTWIFLIFEINLPHKSDLLKTTVSRSQMLHDSFYLLMDAFGKIIPRYVFILYSAGLWDNLIGH